MSKRELRRLNDELTELNDRLRDEVIILNKKLDYYVKQTVFLEGRNRE
jgi:hypothetical protein